MDRVVEDLEAPNGRLISPGFDLPGPRRDRGREELEQAHHAQTDTQCQPGQKLC